MYRQASTERLSHYSAAVYIYPAPAHAHPPKLSILLQLNYRPGERTCTQEVCESDWQSQSPASRLQRPPT